MTGKTPHTPPTIPTTTRPLQTFDPAEGKFDFSNDEEDDEPLAEGCQDVEGESIFSAPVAHYELLLHAHAPFAHMAVAERALITHLRSAPVALADLRSLLYGARLIMPSDLARTSPGLLTEKRKIKVWFDNANVVCNRNMISALAGNVAYFAA